MERAERASGWALACALAAAVVLVATWRARLVVVDGHVVLGWAVSAGLLTAAAGQLVVGRRHRPGRRDAALAVGALTLAGVLLAAGGHLLWGVAYRGLTPVGPTGCRVLVQETSFLVAGAGEVYVLQGASGLARHVGSYTADDGGRPVSEGSYTLTWDGDHATLELLAGDPVTPGSQSLGCG